MSETQPAPVYSIGLTGGIGSGKTLVADIFAALGAAVIDTDQIAHQLSAPHGAAIPLLVAEFGDGFITAEGALDRAKMRALVFAEPAARQRLEAILHPLIRLATEEAAARSSGPYRVFAVPLLVESGTWKSRINRLLVVDCPESLQVERVMRRSGLDAQEVRAIMSAQATRAQRLEVADDVIVNDGDAALLRPQVERLHALYLQRAAGTP
ncbi:MAG: coaE [Herminiimonas sp.]|nr:coaE [Herminiimonas sp.]MDB5852586.1 coaE [Herminiimonas sp.]